VKFGAIAINLKLLPLLSHPFSLPLSPSLYYPRPLTLLWRLMFLEIFFIFHFQDPELFIPDRWGPNDPDAEKLKEMNFPFSLGKRNCVGQNLAMLEIKLVLASIFKDFRFELQSPVSVDYCIILKPANANVKVFKC
jgi:Cytochrome P450